MYILIYSIWTIFVGHDQNKSEPINLLRFSIVKISEMQQLIISNTNRIAFIIYWIYVYIDLFHFGRFLSDMTEINQDRSIY